MKFNCWKENVALIERLCKYDDLKCTSKELHTDIEGDTLCEVNINGQWSASIQNYYDENRVRKN